MSRRWDEHPEIKHRPPFRPFEREETGEAPAVSQELPSDLAELREIRATDTLIALRDAVEALDAVTAAIDKCQAGNPLLQQMKDAGSRGDMKALRQAVKEARDDFDQASGLEVYPLLRMMRANAEVLAGAAAAFLDQPILYNPGSVNDSLEQWTEGKPVARGLSRANWRIVGLLEEIREDERRDLEELVQAELAKRRAIWQAGLMPRLVFLDAAKRIGNTYWGAADRVRHVLSMTPLDFYVDCQGLMVIENLAKVPDAVLSVLRELMRDQFQEIANAQARLESLLEDLSPRSLLNVLNKALSITRTNLQPLVDYIEDLKNVPYCLEQILQRGVERAEMITSLMHLLMTDIYRYEKATASQVNRYLDGWQERASIRAQTRVMTAVQRGAGRSPHRIAREEGLDRPLCGAL